MNPMHLPPGVPLGAQPFDRRNFMMRDEKDLRFTGGSMPLLAMNEAFLVGEEAVVAEEAVFLEEDLAMTSQPPDSFGGEGDSLPSNETTTTDDLQRHIILGMYVALIFLWVILTIVLGVAPWVLQKNSKTEALNWFVFFIPIIIMLIGMVTIYYVDDVCGLSNNLRGGNVLYLGILVAIPLFGMLESNYKGDRKHFATLVLASISIAVVSQFDVWGTSNWACLINHLSSNMKTLSVGLLLFVLVLYVNNGNYVVTAMAAGQIEKQAYQAQANGGGSTNVPSFSGAPSSSQATPSS